MNPMFETILKLLFSKSGVAVRWLVGYLIAAVAAKHVVPDGDLQKIQLSLESGLSALVALGYAGLQLWLNHHNAKRTGS